MPICFIAWKERHIALQPWPHFWNFSRTCLSPWTPQRHSSPFLHLVLNSGSLAVIQLVLMWVVGEIVHSLSVPLEMCPARSPQIWPSLQCYL